MIHYPDCEKVTGEGGTIQLCYCLVLRDLAMREQNVADGGCALYWLNDPSRCVSDLCCNRTGDA